MNLFEKIQAVSNEIKNIEKNMTVGKGNYSYKAVSDLDVTLRVKEAETKHKILSIPTKQELVKSETINTIKDEGKTGIMHSFVIKMTVRIIDLESPSDFIEVETYGHGLDSGDKGFGKASTYARKYALLNAYKIATGEDPDADASEKTKVITVDEKKNQVFDYMLKDDDFRNKTLGHFNAADMSELSTKEIDTIFNNLTKKGKL